MTGVQTCALPICWDTHEYQPGRFRNQVERLSQGLGAFYNDMARYHDRITVAVITEFGRRLRSNRSNGTDHGRGSVMMALGGRVAGGRVLGAGILAPSAGEMIGLWALAIAQRAKLAALASLIVPYPTRAEAGKRAAGNYFVPRLFSSRTKSLVRLLARLP